MTRLATTFANKKNNILNIYCTAGFPTFNSTVLIMKALQDNGVDMIELGMPYSDPLADGETIQHSSTVALANGMTIAKLFEQLRYMRDEITIPVILMGYMNPVLQYGFENFCADASKAGIDGLILPDLPAFEFESNYKSITDKYNLNFIFMITPETAEERIKKLDALSSGFIYAVSSSSTTGNEKDFDAVEKYLQRLQGYQLKNPILVGFGIKDHASFSKACKYANGAVIGTAYVKKIATASNTVAATREFVQSVLN